MPDDKPITLTSIKQALPKGKADVSDVVSVPTKVEMQKKAEEVQVITEEDILPEAVQAQIQHKPSGKQEDPMVRLQRIKKNMILRYSGAPGHNPHMYAKYYIDPLLVSMAKGSPDAKEKSMLIPENPDCTVDTIAREGKSPLKQVAAPDKGIFAKVNNPHATEG